MPISRVGVGSKFMNEFESIKKMFTGKDLDKKYHLPLPMLGKALKARKMHPAQYDFDDFMVEITGLVEDLYTLVIVPLTDLT